MGQHRSFVQSVEWLTLIVTILIAGVGGVWAVFTYIVPPKSDAALLSSTKIEAPAVKPVEATAPPTPVNASPSDPTYSIKADHGAVVVNSTVRDVNVQ